MKQERTSILLDIYERFGDKAQQALDFVSNNLNNDKAFGEVPAGQGCETIKFNSRDDILPNGVYIVLNNGDFYRYTKDESVTKSVVKHIGIAYDGHYFGIPLDWSYGRKKLLKRDDHPKDEYCQTEIQALAEWDFVKHTDHLKDLGLAFDLKDGHYLYTPAMWVAIYSMKDEVNAALKAVGAEEINFKECYWFAERFNVNTCFVFGGYSVRLGIIIVHNAAQVGAVTLWNPE